MKIRQLKEYISNFTDDEDEVFVLIYDKDDMEWHFDDENQTLTPEQWSRVVRAMDNDESIHQAASESFSYYVDEVSTVVVTVETK